ncbi:MAG: PDZ domain-containing protein [Spirochaetaceae bacterium]|nr:MAG: PDZ domain-containing protein [Spirochaetaceae bacterium]
MRRTIRHMFSIACLLASVLMVSGCAGMAARSVDPSRRREFIAEDLRERIDSGNPEYAIARLGVLGEDDLFSEAELNEFAVLAEDALERLLTHAIEASEYRDALRFYRSLRALGREELLNGATSDDLLRRWADHEIQNGNEIAGLHLLLRLPDLTSLSDDELDRFAQVAFSNNNRFMLEQLSVVAGERDIEVPEEYGAFLEHRPTAAQLIEGTATIWVNRGVRLERGVGIPDRVIGSGFFIDRRGYLITNYHVIESEVDPTYRGFSRLFVRLPRAIDRRIPARVVGYNRIFDIALLKVEIDPSYIFSFTEIRTLEPGTQIFAIGSPGGLENSITSGIISATGRRFLQLGDAMQVDVPVNPGNSGGPVVNREGDLVGVVFAGIPQFQGVNFAIPSFWINHFLPQLYQEGEVEHAWMGVAVHETAERELKIIFVAPGSPADRAGIRSGDVLLELAGWRPTRINDAQTVLLDRIPGELVNVRVRRNGGELDRLVAVAVRPFSPIEDLLDRVSTEELFPPLFGMETSNISTNRWQRNFVVTHVYPGMLADESGLSAQDPFSLQNWRVDLDRRIAILQIIIRQRRAGFLESGLQLATFLERDNFL